MNKLPLLCILLALGLYGCDGTATRGTAAGGATQDSAPGDNTPPVDEDEEPGEGEGEGEGEDDGGDNAPPAGEEDDDDAPPPDEGEGDDDTGSGGDEDEGGGDTDTGGGALLDCLNPDFAVVGTRQMLRYRSTSGSGSLEFTTDILVNRETSFNGTPVLEAVTEEQGATNSSTVQLYTLDATSGVQRTYQVTSEAQSPVGSVTTVVDFDPFWEVRFDLDPGESNIAEYTVTTETEVPGSPFPAPATESEVVRTRTYTGRESITVPAGTFVTCRVEEIVTGNGNSDESNVSWFGVGSGVLIRQMASDGSGGNTTTTELLDGSVNGNDL